MHLRHTPPIVTGTTDIPKYHSANGIYSDIVRQIPEDKALVLQFETEGDLLRGQGTIHQAARNMMGSGYIRTKRNGHQDGCFELLIWRVTPPGQLERVEVDVA